MFSSAYASPHNSRPEEEPVQLRAAFYAFVSIFTWLQGTKINGRSSSTFSPGFSAVPVRSRKRTSSNSNTTSFASISLPSTALPSMNVTIITSLNQAPNAANCSSVPPLIEIRRTAATTSVAKPALRASESLRVPYPHRDGVRASPSRLADLATLCA